MPHQKPTTTRRSALGRYLCRSFLRRPNRPSTSAGIRNASYNHKIPPQPSVNCMNTYLPRPDREMRERERVEERQRERERREEKRWERWERETRVFYKKILLQKQQKQQNYVPLLQHNVVGVGTSVWSLLHVLPGNGRRYNQCAPTHTPEKDMEYASAVLSPAMEDNSVNGAFASCTIFERPKSVSIDDSIKNK